MTPPDKHLKNSKAESFWVREHTKKRLRFPEKAFEDWNSPAVGQAMASPSPYVDSLLKVAAETLVVFTGIT